MSKVLGNDVILSFFDGGFYKPYACALNCTLELTTDIIETSVSGAGNFATWEATRDSWGVTCDGIVSLEEVNKLDLAELQALQIAHTKIFIHFTRTSTSGQTYECSGYVIITNSQDTGNFSGMDTFSLTMKGTGILSQSFIPSPINPPGMSHRLEYTLADGEDTYTNALLVGKSILEVIKASQSIDEIITSGTPNPDQAKYISAAGSIQTGTVFDGGERAYVIYQDM